MSLPRSQQGRGWEGRLWHDLSVLLLRRPGSPSPPRNMCGQGTGANLACFWEHRQTQPWPQASTLSQMDRRQVQGRGHWLWPGVWGASGHCCTLGILSARCMGILLPGALPGRFRRLDSLHLLFARSRDAQGTTRRSLGERKRDIGGGRASCLGLLPVPLPGCSPGGPDVLRPLKPLVLSPWKTWLCVCEWFTPPLSPVPRPHPSRGTERQGRIHVPTTEAEKVFYIRYLFNIPF